MAPHDQNGPEEEQVRAFHVDGALARLQRGDLELPDLGAGEEQRVRDEPGVRGAPRLERREPPSLHQRRERVERHVRVGHDGAIAVEDADVEPQRESPQRVLVDRVPVPAAELLVRALEVRRDPVDPVFALALQEIPEVAHHELAQDERGREPDRRDGEEQDQELRPEAPSHPASR